MMDRTPLCLAFVAVLILLASSPGCIGIFDPPRTCDYCGCYLEARFDMSETAVLTLTGEEMEHKDLYKTTEFKLKFRDENVEKGHWLFTFQSESSNETKAQLNYKITMGEYIDSRMYEERRGIWNNFSFVLEAFSTDDYMNSKRFFNGSNSIDGKLMVGEEDQLNVTLDQQYPGVNIDSSGERDYKNALVVNDLWYFRIGLNIGTICVDASA